MSDKKKYRKGLIALLLISSAVLVTWFLSELGFFSRMELASFDHRVSIFRADKPLHEDVVVLLIDETSLQEMSKEFGRWPWPRSAYADILQFFSLANAQALAFDILFTEREQSDQHNASDEALIQATREAGNAVHAMQLLHSEAASVRNRMPDDFINAHQIADISFVGQNYNDYLIPLEGLYRATRDVGYLEIEPDRDGVYRRIRLFNQYLDQHVFPALSSALVIPLISDGSNLHQDHHAAIIGDTRIPLDGEGQYLINPAGNLKTIPVHLVFKAMQQIRQNDVDNLVLDPADFKNKIILLGASAIGLLDVKATAMSNKEAGVFLHAYAISNILEQDFLQPAGSFITNTLLVIFSVLTVVPVLFMSRLLIATVIPVLMAFGYVFVAYASFSSNMLLTIMPPLFAIMFSLLLAYSYRTFSEKHNKQRVRAMLSQYVSPSVLTYVVDNFETLNAEIGSKENLSILFSDIRGFTQISETQEASKVVDMLNIYFSTMTDVIFDHKGTLDKFIGDAIMAFWGAPIKAEDYAQQAVLAAIDMRTKLPEVNQNLSAKGYPEIDIGIGIHTGNVILGNIGSAKKLDYTVIGDSVNLASRIEGITKQYDVPLLISEDTLVALADSLPCMIVDAVRLKGKKQPVKLFTPAELFKHENNLSIPVKEIIRLSSQAFSAYQQGKWDDALAIYQQLPQTTLFKILCDRCVAFNNNDSGKNWDGVYTHTSK